jgi:hypothetical protein
MMQERLLMSTNESFLIKEINSIDPSKDKQWVPDGENMWFLPIVLDFINQTYSGYWYGTKHAVEDKHYHTGLAQGTVLQGKMLLFYDDKKLTLKSHDSFLLPPNTIHSADMIPGEKGFLIFGIIVGQTRYIDNNEFLDVESYYDSVIRHYNSFGLNPDKIAINR